MLPYFKNSRRFWPALIMVLGLLAFSCSGQYRIIEDKLYACLADCAADEGIDLDRELHNAEAYLVDQDILKSGSPESYIDVFKAIRQRNDGFNIQGLENNIHPYFEQSLGALMNTSCMTGTCRIDSRKLSESKSFRLFNAIRNITDVTPATVADTILSILEKEDFKSPYFRLMTIITIYRMNNTDSKGLRVKLPPKPGPLITDTSNKTIKLEVSVNSKDELIVDGKRIALDDLHQTAYDFIVQHGSDGWISLQNDRGTTYERYLQVYHELKRAYLTARNIYAMEKYKKPMSMLNETEKREVIERYPVSIAEAAPSELGN